MRYWPVMIQDTRKHLEEKLDISMKKYGVLTAKILSRGAIWPRLLPEYTVVCMYNYTRFSSCDNQFSQNPDLGAELRKTRGTTLVEAAPRDRVWGIGLSEKNWKAKHRKHWRGI